MVKILVSFTMCIIGNSLLLSHWALANCLCLASLVVMLWGVNDIYKVYKNHCK